jgi:hypothetical protein
VWGSTPATGRVTLATVRELLERDHARLDGLLSAAEAAGSQIDLAAYEEFRARLLRHIGQEEKILLPAARRLRSGKPMDLAAQLKADHAALAALLVPTPTPAILKTLRWLLAAHNALEEGPHGVYAACEALAGPETDLLLDRLRAAGPVPTAAHYDGPRAFAAIDRLVRATGRTPPA